MLEKMPKHPAGRPPENRSQAVTDFPPSYEQIGIRKQYAARWQAEARVPDQHYHAYLADCREVGRIPTLDAERKAGEMIPPPEERHPRGRPKKTFQDGTFLQPTLEQLGLTRKQAFRWQAEASVPEQHYHAYLAGGRFFPAADASEGATNPARPWAQFLSWPLRPAAAAMVSSNLREWKRLL